jgi:hypothetical protein
VWADLANAPDEVIALANETGANKATAWASFTGGGIFPTPEAADALSLLLSSSDLVATIASMPLHQARALHDYLARPARGLFFDPTKNHDGWVRAPAIPDKIANIADTLLLELGSRLAINGIADSVAEEIASDNAEIAQFSNQLEEQNYSVPDQYATAKTRGSAQRVFAEAVKANYGNSCALTGISTKDFLIASHIVPWSADESIRLDPSNGICLSLLIDRAFEKGYLRITEDRRVAIDWERVGSDANLRAELERFDGVMLRLPVREPPRPEYLIRRSALLDDEV